MAIKTPLLDSVDNPSDLKQLDAGQLPQLANELRDEVIDAASETGGHFGAGLGVVELTVALHYVFNTPDLRPMIATQRNAQLGLDDVSARSASPLLWPSPTAGRFEAWVGGDESSEFKRQADTIAACWAGTGLQAKSVTVPNKNHFTVIETLRDENSAMTKAIAAMTRI